MKKLVLTALMVVLLINAVFAGTGDVLKVIDLPQKKLTGLTWNGKHIWIADSISKKILAIDPETSKVVKEYESPGHDPQGLAWDGQALWHIDSAQDRVYKIEPGTGKIIKVISSCCDDPRDITWDGKCLWVTDYKMDVLIKMSVSDGSAVASFKSPGREPTGVTFDGKYLWVADRNNDRIYLVDPENGMCLSSLRSYGPFPYGLAWADGTLFNADFENSQIFQVKIFDDDILTRWDKKDLHLNFVKEFRTYGPGSVRDLNIYLPIPHSRDNQQLTGEVTFEIQPNEIIEDKWGQKIAHYNFEQLNGYQDIKVGWKLTAEVYAAEYFIHPGRVGTLDDIPSEIKEKYLADGEKYEINDESIQKIAKEIAGDESNPFLIARKITEYLADNLSYNLKPIGYWNPAPFVLKRGTASCSEYSYSMIALCRALGIPARYVGAVCRRGDDGSVDYVFHRWVEVYLPPYGWIPFDANKADKKLPGDRVLGVGNVSANYIITTENGGGDEYLWFGYNHGRKWVSTGKCEVHENAYGIWSPAGEKTYNEPEKN